MLPQPRTCYEKRCKACASAGNTEEAVVETAEKRNLDFLNRVMQMNTQASYIRGVAWLNAAIWWNASPAPP
jgi:hypothetical protein